ncbi:hypothetical protein lerEdw1_018016 [Lerista edwardsae]|nr:hypothetical protein lerEdw1_018016 [Lerista edwardsae]
MKLCQPFLQYPQCNGDVVCVPCPFPPPPAFLQRCSPGFYRVPSTFSGRRPGPALGACVPCQCHGHSDICDPETSICQSCRHNTSGDRCEKCALGFYGIIRGSPNDCRPCACPLPVSSNNFSPSCIMEGTSDYRCTACPRGYEGQYCER